MARSRSRADNNDTIDLAVLGGLKDEEALKAYEVVHFQPFDPVHKRTEAAVKAKDGKTFKVTKGAPQVILALAANAGQVKAAVEGHLTIFLTRTRGPFWSIRPAKTLWIAVLGTQIVATLIGVYGLFMTPLGWGWALFVWGYALAWFLLNDRVKLLGYRILIQSKPSLSPKPNVEPKPETKTEPKLQAKDESKRETKADPKTQAKSESEPKAEAESKPVVEPQPDAKTPSDLTPQIVKRVHELYEQLGREDVRAVEDLEKAERENRKYEPHK